MLYHYHASARVCCVSPWFCTGAEKLSEYKPVDDRVLELRRLLKAYQQGKPPVDGSSRTGALTFAAQRL